MSTPPDLPAQAPSSGDEAVLQLKAGMRRARRILADAKHSLTNPDAPAPPADKTPR